MTETPMTARLSCGCEVGFEPGLEGSPVTVVVRRKASSCQVGIHAAGLPLYDHREALRPATRPISQAQPDYEES